jgi:hypothetical protein
VDQVVSVSTSMLNEVYKSSMSAFDLLHPATEREVIDCISYRPSESENDRGDKDTLTSLPAYGRYTSK